MRLAPLGLVLIALAAAGCGGGSSNGGSKDASSKAVFEAASITSGAGTARMSIAGTVTAVGQDISISGNGVLDLKGRRADIHTKAGPVAIEEVMQGHVFYMRSPELSRAIGSTKPWIRFDVNALGLNLSSLGSTTQDPTQILRYLRAAGSVIKVGSHTVRGVAATHYHAVVDLKKVPNSLPASQRAAAAKGIQKLLSLGAQSSIPIDVWIDASHHVRRIKLDESVAGATTSLTEDLYDYGARVHIPSPSRADSTDISKRAAQQLGGVGS